MSVAVIRPTRFLAVSARFRARFLPSSRYTTASLRPLPTRYAGSRIVKGAGILTLGIGTALAFSLSQQKVYCDAPPKTSIIEPSRPDVLPPPPPPPQSEVQLYKLTFGSVCGICAGVFIKKGAKLVAFALGGIFVLLQYLASRSFIRVNWSYMSNKYEQLAYTSENGIRKPPSVYTVWQWILDFLTADFQPRASFIAGLVLGLRIG